MKLQECRCGCADVRMMGQAGWYYVMCENCENMTSEYEDMESAANEWNSRAEVKGDGATL